MTTTPDPLELPESQPEDDRSRDIGVLQERFLAHIRRAGSAASAATYGSLLGNLRDHLEARGVLRIQQLREEHLESWQDSLVERGLQTASRALAATALRSWLRWLMERELVGWRLLRAVTAVKRPKGRARPIPAQDLARVFDHLAPRRRGRSIWELRDRALFFYLFTTGARISEVLGLDREHYVDVLVRQKGGRERRMRIPAQVERMVAAYVAARADSLPQLWIAEPRGRPVQPLSRQGANGIWRKMATALRLEHWSNHRLRDSSATFLALKRLPTHVIADHLGHADLRTVPKYIQIAEEQRADVLEAMAGLFDEIETQVPKLRQGVKLKGRPDRRRPK